MGGKAALCNDHGHRERRGLPATQGLSEDAAISLMTVGVDFGVTQIIDGNWGVHAVLKKSIFAG
jgi:acetamidase/formamidase